MGQWLRNPEEYDADHYWPSPLLTMSQLTRLPKQRRYMFVSDGGHLDNTGLSGLLERKCKLMFFADATFDEKAEFSSLRLLLHGARAKYGIRVEDVFTFIDGKSVKVAKEKNCFDELTPESGLANSHFLIFRLRYSDGEGATLFVAKTTVTRR